jgi:hypothetical protein
MDYLELHHSIEPKVVGVRNGLGAAYISDTFYQKNPWYQDLFGGATASPARTERWAKMPDHGQPLHQMQLFKSAKLPDLLDAGLLKGFIVSDKLRLLLEQHHLPRHRYFEATFLRGEQEIGGYWWLLYDLDDGRDTLDFAQSEFDFSWHTREFDREFRVTSYQEHRALIEETGRPARTTKAVFNQHFDTTLDLWGPHLLWLHRGYISPKLLQAFQEHGITGHHVREPRHELLFSQ